MKAIWEEVSSNFPISWLDVLEFREAHYCNPKQSINALNYRYHQKQYQEQTRSNTYPQNTTTDLLTRQHHNNLSILSNNHSFPPLTTPHMPAQCVYGTNGYNYTTYAPVASHYAYPVPLAYQQTAMKPPPYATNGYCCNNVYPTGYVYPVPTGQLIELEGGGGYDSVDATRQQKQQQHRGSLQNNNNNNNVIMNNIETSDREEGGFENWDYVYKNLESQGYSKDLGERGDILNALEIEKNRHRKTKPTNLDEVINTLAVSDRPLKINEALEKYKETDRKKQEDVKKVVNTTPSSSYENLTKTTTTKSKVTKEKTKAKLEVGKKAKTTVESVVKSADTVVACNGVVNKWQCSHCTYLNESGRDICEMCSKSKVIVEQKMEIGGSQCPKCTLVNPRESTNCQACDESLKDSPTYI